MTTDQTPATPEPEIRELLNTLLERWEEVAEAYKPGDAPWDDHTTIYADYRHIYLRNMRDLRHVLDTGRMPCSLMTDEERQRGDCGLNHGDGHDNRGWADETTTRVEGAGIPEAVRRVIAGHVAEALLESRSDEVRTWTRSLTHELRRAGIDLREQITARFTEIAVGRLAEDHPF